ncbi:MAG: hypothetical protein ACK4PR_02265 [Gammaproteobacteria bacterium]
MFFLKSSVPPIKCTNFNQFYDAVYWALYVPPSEKEKQISELPQEEIDFMKHFYGNEKIKQQPQYRLGPISNHNLRRTQYLTITQDMDQIRKKYNIPQSGEDEKSNTDDAAACKELLALLTIYKYVIWQESFVSEYQPIKKYGELIDKLISNKPRSAVIEPQNLQIQYDQYLKSVIESIIKDNDIKFSADDASWQDNFHIVIPINLTISKQQEPLQRLIRRLTFIAALASLLDIKDNQRKDIYETYQNCQRILWHWSTDLEKFNPKSKDDKILKTTYGYWDRKGKLHAAFNKLHYRIRMAISEMQSKASDVNERKYISQLQNLDLLKITLTSWFEQNDISSDDASFNEVMDASRRTLFQLVIHNTLYKIKASQDLKGNINLIERLEKEANIDKFCTDLPKNKQFQNDTWHILKVIHELARFVAKLQHEVEQTDDFLITTQNGLFCATYGHTWYDQLRKSVDSLVAQFINYDLYIVENNTVKLNENFTQSLLIYIISLVLYRKDYVTTDGELAQKIRTLAVNQLNNLIKFAKEYNTLKPLLKKIFSDYAIISLSLVFQPNLQHIACRKEELAKYHYLRDHITPLLINITPENIDPSKLQCEWPEFYAKIFNILNNSGLSLQDDILCSYIKKFLNKWQTELINHLDTEMISNGSDVPSLATNSSVVDVRDPISPASPETQTNNNQLSEEPTDNHLEKFDHNRRGLAAYSSVVDVRDPVSPALPQTQTNDNQLLKKPSDNHLEEFDYKLGGLAAHSIFNFVSQDVGINNLQVVPLDSSNTQSQLINTTASAKKT